jgi:hypothetical protein
MPHKTIEKSVKIYMIIKKHKNNYQTLSHAEVFCNGLQSIINIKYKKYPLSTL